MAKFCKCEIPVPNFDGTCKECARVLTWEQSAKYRDYDPKSVNDSDEDEDFTKAIYKPIQKEQTMDDQNRIGNEAARRTIKYASLFESIGKVMQVLNVIGLVVLFFIGFFIPGSGWMKFAFWLAVLIVWAISYVQTSLIRGLSSYFQMKASDHLIRNWKNK